VQISDWDAVTAHAGARLIELRKRLEADCDDLETAAIRARIKELKLLLDLRTEKKEPLKLESPRY
jgi:hypothetical protein